MDEIVLGAHVAALRVVAGVGLVGVEHTVCEAVRRQDDTSAAPAVASIPRCARNSLAVSRGVTLFSMS